MSPGHSGVLGRPRRLLVVAASTIGMFACQAQPAPLCPDVYSNVAIAVPAATYAPGLPYFSPINASTAPGATQLMRNLRGAISSLKPRVNASIPPLEEA